MKKILFISGHSRKKNIYVLDKKGRKKNMIEKSVQKKKHNIDTKKKIHVQKQKRKKMSQHWKPLDLCHPGDYVPIS